MRPGQDVARVHSGDPSLYGAIAEQIRRLDALGIPWTITPGVPAFAAAAAALGGELTLPDVAQTVILTRTAVRASAMPEGEDLAAFAAHRRDARASTSRSTISPTIVRELVADPGRRLPGGRRLPRHLARRADHARHARHHPRHGEGGRHHPHGADPGRPGAGETRFSRQPALRRRSLARPAAEDARPASAMRLRHRARRPCRRLRPASASPPAAPARARPPSLA